MWRNFQQKEHRLGVARPRPTLWAADNSKVYEACSWAKRRLQAMHLLWEFLLRGKFCPAKGKKSIKVHKKVRCAIIYLFYLIKYVPDSWKTWSSIEHFH